MQNICFRVDAFVIPFNLINLKKLSFDLLTTLPGLGGGKGCGQNICYLFAALAF